MERHKHEIDLKTDDEVNEEDGSIWDHTYRFCTRKIKIREDYAAGLGGTLFDGALCLCNFIEFNYLANDKYFKNVSVLELGAGCGLPGILAYKLGANVIVSDIKETFELMQENIDNNKDLNVSNKIEAKVLNWLNEADLDELLTLNPNGFDFILAADTVYNLNVIDKYLQVLERCCHSETRILFAHPAPRNKAASEYYWNKIFSDDSKFTNEKVNPMQFVPNYEQLKAQGRSVFADSTNGVFILRKK